MKKLLIHYGKFRDEETFCGLGSGSICIDPKAELAKEQVNCQDCIRSHIDRQLVKKPKRSGYEFWSTEQPIVNRPPLTSSHINEKRSN